MSKSNENQLELLAAGVKGMAEALKPLSVQMSDVMRAVSGSIKAFSNFRSVIDFKEISNQIKEQRNKINEFITGIQAKLEKGFTTAFNKIKEIFSKISDEIASGGIKGAFQKLKDQIQKFKETHDLTFSGMKKSISGYFKDLKEQGAGAFESLKDKSSSLWQSFKTNPFASLSKAVTGFGAVAAGVFVTGIAAGIVLAVAAISGFIAYFRQLMDKNEEFREKVVTLWKGVKEAFQPAIDAFGQLLACLVQNKETISGEGDEIARSFLTVAENIIGGITEVVSFFSDIISGVAEFIKEILFTTSEDAEGRSVTTWETIKEAFAKAMDFIKEIFDAAAAVLSGIWDTFGEDVLAVIKNVWETISNLLSGAIDVVGGVFEVIVGLFTGNGEKIREGFGRIWEGIKGIFSGMGKFFKGVWDEVISVFSKVGTKVGNAIGGAFKAVVNTVITFAQGIINGFLKAINGAIDLINKIPGVEIKKIKLINIPLMASGGIVEKGQLFIAREAGPELVGNIGAKTAVMNNNQIVEAVSRGVYEAVRNAMAGGGTYTFNISNRLDGREIGRQVIKYHNGVVRQTGMSPLTL